MARRGLVQFGLASMVGLWLAHRPVQAQMWTYDTIGPGDDGSCPGRVALAPDGGVIAAGAVDSTDDPTVFAFGHDMLLAKLDPSTGAEIWRATFDGLASGNDYANATAVDAAGDVFAGGYTDNGNRSDYTVLKVDGSSGAEIWRTSIDGDAHVEDAVTDIAVDGAGDVIAVGDLRLDEHQISRLTVTKFRGSDGALLWRHDVAVYLNVWALYGATVTVDAAGNAYVGGGTYDEGTAQPYFTVAKLAAADGAELWRYDHAATTNCAVRDVAVNAAGEVAAAGTCANDTYGATVARLNGATGAEIWLQHLYGGGVPNEGIGFAVAIDSQGDVLMSGNRSLDFENLAFWVVKFDGASGAVEWQQAIMGAAGPASFAFDLAVDAHDDVIAVGDLDNSPAYLQTDLAAVKLAGADGSVLWRQEFGGYPETGGRFRWLALDAAGDAYAIGDRWGDLIVDPYGYQPSRQNSGIVVAKIDGETGGAVRLAGESLRMRDGSDASKRSLVVSARSHSVASMPTSSSDPRNTGAVLRISNTATGESASINLPAGGWAPSGGFTARKGFVYRDAGRSRGPCHVVRLQKGRSLKVSCKGGGIGFTLDEASQGSIQVELITGPLRQCMRFGGVVADEQGTFRARKSLRPASCD